MYTAGLVLVGALGLLNLLLTLGIVRRLREHSRLIGHDRSPGPGLPSPILEAGTAAGGFSTEDYEGKTVTNSWAAGEALVGFFSPECGACELRIPDFVDYARKFDDGRRQIVAVAVDADGKADRYVDEFSVIARVVVEPPGGPMSAAFSVYGFPSFCLVGTDGVVLASGYHLEGFPNPSAL